ncbi:MAG: type II toxin-antitoxin system VapC family toxin [Thermomicrobiales bacterium]
MAYKSGRAEANLHAVRDYLTTSQIHSIDAEATDVYGRIKAAVLHRWGPRERAKQRHFAISHLGFTDNDLWIAAIAVRQDLIVVSEDGDFARIAEVTDLRHESWLGSQQ